jgi:predicted DNA-binding transcriptional regulator YafY
MDKFERVTLLHRLLKAARLGKAIDEIEAELGISRATVYRDLMFLRDVLGAPLENVGVESGQSESRWRYARDQAAPFELPGIWLSPEELYALVLTRQVVAGRGDEDESLLAHALDSMQTRIQRQLGAKAENLRRLRVIRHNPRQVNQAVFRAVTLGTLERKQLQISYRARSTEEPTERTIHPQRLIHYRDNWYVDALDNTRSALRSFALDRMNMVRVLDAACTEVPDADLSAELTPGYGIFSGPAKSVATIIFSKHAARWAAEERWHSQQKSEFLADGRYQLKVPYASARELLMDVLRYGPDAEIVSPVALREQMRSTLTLMTDQYGITH